MTFDIFLYYYGRLSLLLMLPSIAALWIWLAWRLRQLDRKL